MEDFQEYVPDYKMNYLLQEQIFQIQNLEDEKTELTKNMIKKLEDEIDLFEKELEPLTNFILPGGDHVAALIHFARTVTDVQKPKLSH